MARMSAWQRGVNEYASELKDFLKENKLRATEQNMLNGARDWKEYSYGGNSLIYNEDIARRLSSPSELKKTNYGQRRPNSNEEWLDTQARALYQASRKVINETAIAKDIARVRGKRG